MKKVLVTGANGFIGRHTIPLLIEKGFEVHCVDIKLPEVRESYTCWHEVDLMDSEKMMKLLSDIQPTYLLHFAWFAVPGEYWTSTENIRWVQASLSLLQAFANNGGKRVVMAGTCAEYDWDYGYCSEKVTPLRPATLYGVCKHSLQMMLSAFSKQTGLSSAWGRIFFLYGPYEYPKRLVSSVILNLLQNKKAPCSHGNQIRDFLHVEDVASAFVALLESDIMGSVNIASGQPVTLKSVICKIADKLGRCDLVQLGALPEQANDPRVLIADVRRLSDEVKWKPKFELDSGLAQTITWWKETIV